MSKIHPVTFAVLMLFPLFTGCEAVIDGKLYGSGRADLHINASLGPKINALIGRFSSRPGPVLPAAEFNTNLLRFSGVEKSDFIQKNDASIEGTLVIKSIDDILKQNSISFINWKQTQTGGSAVIDINKKNGAQLISLISSELSDYLSALMAPVATGEELTKNEYIELVKSVYGAEIAKEIAGARFRMNLDFPQTIRSIKGGKSAGSTAKFDTPLLDILVLENPVIYEVNWD